MFLLIIIVLTTYLLKYRFEVRTNLHPAFLIPAFSILILLVPIIFSAISSELFVLNYAIEYIALHILFFQIGAIIFSKKITLTNYENDLQKINIHNIKKIQLFLILISGFGIYLSMYEIAKYAGIPLSINNIAQLPTINSKARYSGFNIVQGFSFYIGIFDYVILIIAGVLLANRTHKFYWLSPILMGLFKAFVVGARAGFLISIIFFFTSFLLYKGYLSRGRLTIFTYKNFRLTVIMLTVVLLFFLVIQMSRGGVTDLARIPQILIHLNNWFFAYLSAFSVWLSTYEFNQFTWGSYNLSGLFDMLNLAPREQGIYNEPVIIGKNFRTNVFTIYRGLIMDFHILSVIIMLILGLIASASYNRFIKHHNIYSFFILLSIYSFFFCQHTVSIFNYNIIIASIVIAFLIFKFSKYRIKIFN